MCVPSCQALRAWGCEPAEECLTALHMEFTDCTKRLVRYMSQTQASGPCGLDVIPAFLRWNPAAVPRDTSNTGQGLRSLRDLTQHLTTRADDSHAAPVHHPRRQPRFRDLQVHVKPG